MHLKISCFVKLLRTRSALLSMQYPEIETVAEPLFGQPVQDWFSSDMKILRKGLKQCRRGSTQASRQASGRPPLPGDQGRRCGARTIEPGTAGPHQNLIDGGSPDPVLAVAPPGPAARPFPGCVAASQGREVDLATHDLKQMPIGELSLSDKMYMADHCSFDLGSPPTAGLKAAL